MKACLKRSGTSSMPTGYRRISPKTAISEPSEAWTYIGSCSSTSRSVSTSGRPEEMRAYSTPATTAPATASTAKVSRVQRRIRRSRGDIERVRQAVGGRAV